ncbi:MAG: Rrf2 family transcriptional regulator [Lachnospiraceae bacterium]|nr:Rrf2 family transcriptional regulator [Lachnospiraceae bacterium]
MMISTKGRYALRLMADLAANGDEGRLISLKELAARQQISLKYLEQIVSVLNRAGYVRSVRGPQGGYRLSMPPGQLTVGMILRQMEGDLAPVECLAAHAEPCDRRDDCSTRVLWERLQDAVNNVIDTTTLADLLEPEKITQPGGLQ